MEYDAIEDLHNISTIPKNSVIKITDLLTYIIVNCVEESDLNNQVISEIDIGIGSLIISSEDSNVRYKFIPSNKLNISIKEVLNNKNNPLVSIIEKSLINKISGAYKELL